MKKSKKKIILIISLIVVVAFITALVIILRAKNKDSDDTEEVRTSTAYESVFTSSIDISGYLEAADLQNVTYLQQLMTQVHATTYSEQNRNSRRQGRLQVRGNLNYLNSTFRMQRTTWSIQRQRPTLTVW